MSTWMKDGLIGWGTVVVVGVIASVATDAPYSFLSSLTYMMGVGLLAIPGGILLGRNREEWFWPAIGGFLSAAVFYYALGAITGTL